MLILRLLVILLVLVVLPSVSIQGQSLTIPLIVSNNGSDADTLIFGVHSEATACLDTTLGEMELPPTPASIIFDARFVDSYFPPPCCCLGTGSKVDLRSVTTPTQVDTYLVQAQAGSGGGPLTLSWPDLSSSFSGSITLIGDNGPPIVPIDMKAQSTWSTPGGASHLQSFIIAESPIVTPVGQDRVLPEDFILHQNYPNPFNPSTKIEYGLPHAGRATLKVFDCLGREIVTLIDAMQPAGWRLAEFNPSKLPAGVYYYRLTTDEAFLVRRMLLVK